MIAIGLSPSLNVTAPMIAASAPEYDARGT
jgi:hypothetical protein